MEKVICPICNHVLTDGLSAMHCTNCQFRIDKANLSFLFTVNAKETIAAELSGIDTALDVLYSNLSSSGNLSEKNKDLFKSLESRLGHIKKLIG